jgi:outer membrane lipoprotein LolB
MSLLRALAAGLMAACVAACTSTPALPPDSSDWTTRRAQLEQLEHWQFSGKLAVKTQTSADSARINWQQQGAQTLLTLTGPGGWGRATVTADGHTLVLEKDGQQQRMNLADSAELERKLGWNMPAALLPHWIKGIPAPGVDIAAQTLDAGRLSQLEQAGWTLHYEQYQQMGQYSLPAKIRFEGASASGKILIKHWVLDETGS